MPLVVIEIADLPRPGLPLCHKALTHHLFPIFLVGHISTLSILLLHIITTHQITHIMDLTQLFCHNAPTGEFEFFHFQGQILDRFCRLGLPSTISEGIVPTLKIPVLGSQPSKDLPLDFASLGRLFVLKGSGQKVTTVLDL